MILTDKQLEVMDVFWERNVPMTINAVIEASENRTWSTRSIYKIFAQLEKKGLIGVSHLSPTSTNYAKTYKVLLPFEKYIAKSIAWINQGRPPSIRVGAEVFIQAIKDEWEDA